MCDIHVLWNVTLNHWVFPKLRRIHYGPSKHLELVTQYPTTQRNIPQDFRVQQLNCVNLNSRLFMIISVVVCCTVLFTTIIDSLEIFALLGRYAA